MRRPGRGQVASTLDRGPRWWLPVCAAVAVVVVAAAALSDPGDGGLLVGPLLAIPVALAGIGAPSLRRPLACGVVMLAAAFVFAAFARGSLPWIVAPVPVMAVTALTALGVALTKPAKREQASVAPVEQKLADVTSVAEVVQRALLPPLPERVGPLELEVVYLAAAAQARVGGDLYEVARTQFGIRLIVGDARGKGLDAVETAADVLGDGSAAGRTLPFPPGGALLFYTDGVTEARNPRHRCYPLPARLRELAAASTDGIRPDLLQRVRDDLFRHTGAPLDDDAALVLVRAPAVWGNPAPQPAEATAP